MTPELCLGTAQFGLPYGITNDFGRVDEAVVQEILSTAFDAGIRRLDTAQAYGVAEQVLGRTLPKSRPFKIVTKLLRQSKSTFSHDDYRAWNIAFHRSCTFLAFNEIDALLLHDVNDLRKPGSNYLMHWMLDLRDKGFVKRLGVSIYSAEDLEGISPDLLDVVQLPLSLYDQRLLRDGTIDKLISHGCAIHARSLYLQGLLLSKASDLPRWVNHAIRDHHARLENLASERGCTLLDLNLGFAKAQADLESIVIGICSVNQLRQLLDSWGHISLWKDSEWRNWAIDALDFVDPRRWPN